jgi:HEAT repeat-containing protein 4
MWNDRNRQVKKCAAQTLGRTGKGQEVHDEICQRIQSTNSFDRYEALNKINHIGILRFKAFFFPTLLPTCFIN